MTDEASTADERSVGDLDRAWNDAYERSDRAQLAGILADDFEAVAADGLTITKTQLMQPGSAPRSIAFNERSLRLFDSTAITRGRLRLEHEGGRVDQRFMRVYARRDGRWQAVAVQVSAVVETTPR
jgi:ketosteroid isomerase-like protein